MSTRKTLLLLTGLCYAWSLWALHVQPVGEPERDWMFVENQGDTIYIFVDEIKMRMSDGSAINWYKVDGTLFQSNYDEIIDPDDGGYYTMQGEEKEYFYVFSYKNYKADASDWILSVEPKCETTVLTLSGTLPESMNYFLPDGRKRTVKRKCTISYTDLGWNDKDMDWIDSAAVMTEDFPESKFILPAIYKATDITLSADNIAQTLGLDSVSVSTELTIPIAVKSHMTHRTEVRGKSRENENERPIDESTLQGSAELRIQFYSNPTPAATYFLWRIYKGTQLIFTRNDEDVFEVFSDPSSYRVVNYVTGNECPCETCEHDSTEVTVSISESELKVPNVFTPNGDTQNDEFRVQYRSIAEFHCWVYNRWGKLVYEWTDPAKGWDGTINGRPAAEGAYFYIIRARGTDADPKQGYTSKGAYRRAQLNSDKMVGIYQLSGDINLLRGK